ncbi:hypothetical protein FGIG_10402 [Fasciola gigantica]|uniref:Uncharacterized protein n=1 Tax=Fasciola gigantica TaxID=46835 RepID=A0A504YVV7_FASGI|nr:hypothetical protein FGIG_10402 [Fasciola gigantica]
MIPQGLKGLESVHLFTASKQPQSDGLARNFVHTLKGTIRSINPSEFQEIESRVDDFPLKYENTAHGTKHSGPAKLFNSRIILSNLGCPELYQSDSDLRPVSGVVLGRLSPRMVRMLDIDTGPLRGRHIEQTIYNLPELTVDVETENESVLNPVVITDDTPVFRHSERLASQQHEDEKY